MATTAQRIKEAMEIRNLKQTDLVEKTGISKGALSSYISGSYVPKQKNTHKIAKALNVNESWLMGLDVPMERKDPIIQQMNNEMLFESHLKLIGWTYKHITFTDGLNCEECLDRQAIKLGWESKSKYPDGNYEPFCLHCRIHDDYYIFSNGIISFNVTPEDFKLFIDDSNMFYKNRIQLLLNKYSTNLFANTNDIEQEELAAAHERTDIEITDEMRKHDDDIMDEDNF